MIKLLSFVESEFLIKNVHNYIGNQNASLIDQNQADGVSISSFPNRQTIGRISYRHILSAYPILSLAISSRPCDHLQSVT